LKQRQAITTKGRQCSIMVVEPGIDLCHVHDPNGTYQRQRRGELPVPGRAASAGGQRVDTFKDLRPPERKPRPDPEVIIWADGLAEPSNPGIGCYGWIAEAGGEVVSYGRGVVGERVTSNEAEYAALIAALEWAAEGHIKQLEIRMDSRLVVNQMWGDWQCKARNLQPLLDQAWELVKEVDAFLVWVPRERNREADALSRQAYAEQAGVAL